MKYLLLFLAMFLASIIGFFVAPLFSSDVGDVYYIITQDATRADFKSDNVTIGENTIILTNYQTIGGSEIISGDYILNKIDVHQIRYGKKIIYPENGIKLSLRDKILHEQFYFDMPYWLVFIMITGILIVFLFYVLQLLTKLFHLKVETKPISIISNIVRHNWWLSQEIVIPGDAQGIIGTRDWNYDKKGLISANQGMLWNSTMMTADEKPSSENDKGIYAYQLGTNGKANWAKISGIVSLSGHCVGHDGGLIRAEHCKILMLFCPFPGRSKELSTRYGVPVMLSLDKKADIERWLITHQGISWLKHNADIINGTEAEYEIDEILKKENF